VSEPRDTGWARLSSVRVGAVVAIALAAGFVAWLLVRGNDDSSSSSQTTTAAEIAKPIGPVAATPAALRSVSATAKRPIYWVGPRTGQTYELTRTAGGRVYIRYLPPDAKIGNKRADYTIVGTYPTPNALNVLEDLAKQSVFDSDFKFAGVDDNYFLTAALFTGPAKVSFQPVSIPPAAESKDALISLSEDHGIDVPFVTVRGRRGGSAITSSAVNALAQEEE